MFPLMSLRALLFSLLATTSAVVSALPSSDSLQTRQSLPKLVFAHFMIGIVSDRTGPSDYDDDMRRAKAYGIDAFALNCGTDYYTDTQLGYAYQSAANNGMKVFISFDFNWYGTGIGFQVGQMIARYANLPGQLMVNGQVFASSFAGDGLDVGALKAGANRPVFFVPNFRPGQGDFNAIDGAFSWQAWPSNGYNRAPNGYGSVSVATADQQYLSALKGKPYMASVSPWFFTHYGPEVSYSKNWVFPSDLLWFNRWNEILQMGSQFVEIVTWNDYGESHYVAPLSSKHYDDGASKWVNDMPHSGWLDMAKPYIAAYKAGATSVNSFIQDEQIIYWYRPTLRNLNCDGTDTTMVGANNSSGMYYMGRPDGWESMADLVYVVTLLRSPGILTVNSGGNTQYFNAPAGAASFSVPMGVGRQSFAVARDGQNVLAGVSLRDVSNVCPCGLYNMNAFVGAIPPSVPDRLEKDGLQSLTTGLRVQTCLPTPSLATVAATYTEPVPTSTSVSSSPSSTPIPRPTRLNPKLTTTRAMSFGTSSTTQSVAFSTLTPTSAITSSDAPSSITSTSVPFTSTTATSTTATGCTITASEQIRPTNCLQRGCVWQAPGLGAPDHCDGWRRRS